MEKDLFDTSALIALRDESRELTGATTILNVIEFPKAREFGLLRIIYPTKEDQDYALGTALKLLEIGRPIPAIDLIVAAVCSRRGLALNTKDRHYEHVLRVDESLVLKLVRP